VITYEGTHDIRMLAIGREPTGIAAFRRSRRRRASFEAPPAPEDVFRAHWREFVDVACLLGEPQVSTVAYR
jgi:hypothetical protein